ncbi:hypothetical protein F5I97DRAFT_1808925 [Phlebopus sp. FC_14]|nr:hypothetical protein F5I97DRAFT_1808925 [Phlebopus sp. FC_14]
MGDETVELSNAIKLASSSNGRLSGKPWKLTKRATFRSQSSVAHKTKWDERRERTKQEQAIKMLQTELREEKQAEKQRRREITMQRKRAAEERRRLEEDKAKLGQRKAARLRRKEGRTKKING